MDIEYLLFLQEFRNSINNAWTPFMEWISHFATAYLLLVPAFIYWCISKKKGSYVLFSAVTALAVNSLIKLTACVYRPWIRESRIHPVEGSIHEATGYSFPSGHCAGSGSVYGSIAAAFGGKNKAVAVISILMALTTAFSRNYLGYHTPQDVLVGLLVATACVYGVNRLLILFEQDPEKEDRFLIAGAVLSVFSILYITFKPYPMDYSEGALLVDPVAMMKDGYNDFGMFGAYCLARLIDKRFIRFEASGLCVKGVVMSVLGFIPLFVIAKVLAHPLTDALGARMGALVKVVLIVFFIMNLWPMVIKRVCRK